MSGWLYLIRNGDLYKIGITKNLENRMRQLKPDNVVASLYTSDFVRLEKELHNRYKKYRIPQTEYFRLENCHIKEIKQRISKLDYPMSITIEIFIKSLLSVIFIFFLLLMFFSLNINDINLAVLSSLLWMKRILFGFSLISLFVHSGKYLSVWNEIKYRSLRLFFFIFFSIIFRIVVAYLN